MSMQIVQGFKHFETLHCVTGSMRHVYAWAGHDISEELLLGLGEGVGFAYFRFAGQAPFLGGRAQPKPSMEEIASSRLGVKVECKASSSDAAAEKSLVAELDAGRPAMLQVDMGLLPYFDFGGDYHFGGHVIVACGRESESGDYLVADREGEMHAVSASALAAARGSRYKPFPPGRAWRRFDFSGFHAPTSAELKAAMAAQAKGMLEPPIANIGYKGIAKAAAECVKWPSLVGAGQLPLALFNVYIFTNAKGGTGGGCFRYMFGRFLEEAGRLGAPKASAALGRDFAALGDAWEETAALCLAATEGSGMDRRAAEAALPELSRRLAAQSELERAAWTKLAASL
jgi:Uncharacterized protein conserved in archaea